ncbi:hypothetical protein L3Q82_014538 [Scortum barcoo]|uniref:Uncharacterized protein n=1 Tax=Scortum barcoo TaxID=214431 RepID=A0ACB8VWY4_9TELE|nr:hypothetical protein L3Q82_014538 [Scortum barcoo]
MSLGWPGNASGHFPPEELVEVSGVREVWASLLRLLPPRPGPGSSSRPTTDPTTQITQTLRPGDLRPQLNCLNPHAGLPPLAGSLTRRTRCRGHGLRTRGGSQHRHSYNTRSVRAPEPKQEPETETETEESECDSEPHFKVVPGRAAASHFSSHKEELCGLGDARLTDLIRHARHAENQITAEKTRESDNREKQAHAAHLILVKTFAENMAGNEQQ